MMNEWRLVLLLLSVPLLSLEAHGSEYMLFSPNQQEEVSQLPEAGKGVLVRRITVKPGDTLSKISKEFAGRSSYFPQILLFNNIHNPDLIRAGRELLVPVSRQKAIAKNPASQQSVSPGVNNVSTPELHSAEATRVKTKAPAKKSRQKSAVLKPERKQTPPGQTVSREENDSYSQAINSYRSGKYKESLLLFTRFLEKYPSSPLAADALLYRAESLLKLSGQ